VGRVASGRIGSENLERCAGRIGLGTNGLGTQIWRHKLVIQDAQLSQKERAAGHVIVLAKTGKLELGDDILRKL